MAGVEEIARTSGVKVEQVRNVFEAILQLANQDKRIGVHGFGTFERRLRAGRTVVTPMLNGGEPTQIAPAYSLAFRPSALAKHRLNVSAKKKSKVATKKKGRR